LVSATYQPPHYSITSNHDIDDAITPPRSVYSPNAVQHIQEMIVNVGTDTRSYLMDTTKVDLQTTTTYTSDNTYSVNHQVYVNGTYAPSNSLSYRIDVLNNNTYGVDVGSTYQIFTSVASTPNEATSWEWYPFCYGLVEFLGYGSATSPACNHTGSVEMTVQSTRSTVSWSAAPVIYYLWFIPATYEKVQLEGPESSPSDRIESNALSGSVTKYKSYDSLQLYTTDAAFVYKVE